MKIPPLILASASPRRVELLRQIDLSFEVVPSDAPEASDENLTAVEISQLNAHRKARVVAKHHPDSLVIGADTTVCLGTKLFGKPVDDDHAFDMLSELNGQTHAVVTGLCLLHLRGHRERLFWESSAVTFHHLSPKRIRTYLERVHTRDKAGAYAVQQHGEMLVERITGSFTNVVGLPLQRLRQELELWG